MLGAALKRPVAWPAEGVDIHRPGESGGGSGGGRVWCARRPTVRGRGPGSGDGSRCEGLLCVVAGVGGEDGEGRGVGGAERERIENTVYREYGWWRSWLQKMKVFMRSILDGYWYTTIFFCMLFLFLGLMSWTLLKYS